MSDRVKDVLEGAKPTPPRRAYWNWEGVAYQLGQTLVYAILIAGIVGTWGEPDLIDGVIAWLTDSPLECVSQ